MNYVSVGPAVRDLKEVECRHPIGSEDREGATTASKRYRSIVAHKTRSPASWHVGITDPYRAARRESHGCGCRTGSRPTYDARERRSSMARRPPVRCSVTTHPPAAQKHGRASCRESVGKYV